MKKEIELLEIRRQSAHLLFGFFLVFLLLNGYIDGIFLVGAFFFALFLSLLAKCMRIPVFCHFLDIFERKKDLESLPGKGLLSFLLGSAVVSLIFPVNIAISSILILAFGDSVSHVFGRHFGGIKTPFHAKKHIEGSIFGILVSAIAASFFVPFYIGLIASIVAMLLEFPTIRIMGVKIDDNIIIPISSAICLFLLMQ